MEFQITITFQSNTPDVVGNVTATDWHDAVDKATQFIANKGWSDAVLKNINRLRRDILTAEEVIDKFLEDFGPYDSLPSADKEAIISLIKTKVETNKS